MDVLDQQYQMIMTFKDLDDRILPFARESLFQEEQVEGLSEELQNSGTSTGSTVTRFPESSDLLKMALSFTEKTRKLPKRLRWVVSDRAKMENLLSRLAGMNDFLRDMLDSHRAEMLRTQQIRTNYDIIQLNTKMDQLIEIIKAGSAPVLNSAQSPKAILGVEALLTDDGKRPEASQISDLTRHLVQLAHFKAVGCAVQGHNLDGSVRSKIGIAGLTAASQNKIMIETSTLDLDVPETMLSAQDTVARRVTGCNNPLIPNQERRRIWVEWKVAPRDPWASVNGPEPGVLRRFEALVSLLRESEVTAQFRAPKCLGYYQQRATASEIRYGLVFVIPSSVHVDSSPLSLRGLIADKGRPTPSLTLRVRLMRTPVESVEKLHAVDWLHKGLRSDNIFFFHSGLGDEKVDLSTYALPYRL